MRKLIAMAGALALLAGCSGAEDAPETAEATGAAPQALPAPELPSAEQTALLESRNCRTVAQAYVDAVAAKDFRFAARFWDDPVVDDARIAALFDGYDAPAIQIADVQEEGAAGSLYCTVKGALADGSNADTPLREGELVLRRANDVPGASAQQLNWTLQSSTFVERLERAGRGEPA